MTGPKTGGRSAEALFAFLRQIRSGDMMMRTTLGLLAALLVAAPSISYFNHQRQIQAMNSSGQHYAVVDETLWQHARPDLDDLRIYSAEKEIPYRLTMEQDSSETEQKQCRVLQPGTVDGKTRFLLDMSGVPEYDRIELKLGTKNFVAHARVEGQDDPHGAKWAVLGTTTLYDLSDERLGHNYTLQIPLTTYKYMRVTADNPVKPSDVEGGSAGITRAQKAVWRDLSSEPKQTQQGKDTILTFSVPGNVPVERVILSIDPAQQNFLRGMEIQGDKGERFGSGEIRRVHMRRNGQKIDTEQTSLDLRGTTQGALKVIIHNGDDAPLKVTGARLQQYERRIYFDADSGGQPKLYYGDAKLEAPVYDYAKLFQEDANAGQVSLGAEEANAAYIGRPDDRPWSERHPAVLWVAIIAAVLILGSIALRSMKGTTT
jgi:uncharacterized protein DUF3999